MVAALYDPNNVVVGNAVLFYAPWIAPPGTVTPLVADTVDLFAPASWLSPWLAAGATHEGFKVNVDTSTTTINIEEQSTPVAETIEGKSLTIEAALAEDTIETMQLSWNGGTITTTARTAGTVPGSKKMTLDDTVKYWTVALEMRNSFGLARRLYVPKCSASGSGDTNFRRASDKRTYPIRFASVCKPSDIQIVEITAAE